jgi:eukaryotic-like serine/threonine-protein kinase
MTTGRWHQISSLWHRALARPGEERHAYLQDACEGDESLQREIETLLAADAAPAIIDTPALLEATARAFAEDERPSLIGRRLGGFEIVSGLGTGGMGEVYRARDTKLGRDVALRCSPTHGHGNPSGWLASTVRHTFLRR